MAIGFLLNGWLVAAGASPLPNVIFILADDLGWSDTTLYGSTKFYDTPNVERLARRGLTLTRAYTTSPLCSPTRASLMTGLSPARVGITAPVCHVGQVFLEKGWEDPPGPAFPAVNARSLTRLDTNYFTLARAFKAGGYATAHFGKWHLGPAPYSALDHGFDVDIPRTGAPGPGGGYLAPWPTFAPELSRTAQAGDHIDDRLATEAVQFMRDHKDRPFFLNFWAFSVHAPFNGKPALIEHYRQRADPNNPQRCAVYAAMVRSFDDAVGRLLDVLDELQIADRTIILFLSDNGGNMYDRVEEIPPTSNAPLRGGKGGIYDGGIRVPGVVVWPGKTRAGDRTDALFSSDDVYPTLLAMTGLKPQPGQRFDGADKSPLFRGRRAPTPPVFVHFPHGSGDPNAARIPGMKPATAVIDGGWKLIRFHHDHPDQTDRFELYEVVHDPGEQRDLAARQPRRVKQLAARIEEFQADTGAVIPRPNPHYDPAIRPPVGSGSGGGN